MYRDFEVHPVRGAEKQVKKNYLKFRSIYDVYVDLLNNDTSVTSVSEGHTASWFRLEGRRQYVAPKKW